MVYKIGMYNDNFVFFFSTLLLQVQTQTRDDNAEKEIQTNEIDLADKWTQRPIILMNESDGFSPDYSNVIKIKIRNVQYL